MTTALADVDFINISKKEVAAKLQAKSNDLVLIDMPEKFAPNQGLCLWAPLGALPQTPVIGSCSGLTMVPPNQ